MDLSVIIPCHNLEKYILPLLVSLNLQDLNNYDVEFIFVLDACEDNTESMIRNFPWNEWGYRWVYLITCDVHSCGLARNKGFEHSTGRNILFLDGDDWLLDCEALKKIIYELEHTDKQIVSFKYKHPVTFQFPGYFSMVWQYAFKRELIEDVPFTEIQPDEDVVFMKEILQKIEGEKGLHRMDEILYYYNYLREGSNMRLHAEGKLEREK